jgi:hypothetical protein
MERTQDWSTRRTYYARFENGPRDATVTTVLALDSGQPPDLLLTPGQRDWIYVLAGGERGDGSLPYLWMPRSKVVALQRLGKP